MGILMITSPIFQQHFVYNYKNVHIFRMEHDFSYKKTDSSCIESYLLTKAYILEEILYKMLIEQEK